MTPETAPAPSPDRYARPVPDPADTEARLSALEARVEDVAAEAAMQAGFAETDRGFAEMRGRLDQAAAGHGHTVDSLTTLLRDDER